MRKDASRKDLKVFEFDDVEQSELISKKYLAKFSQSTREEFRTPKPGTSPTAKYQFLKAFSSKAGSQGKKMSFVSCLDVETSESNRKRKDPGANACRTSDRTDCAIKESTSLCDDIQAYSPCDRETDHTSPVGDEGGNTFPGCLSVNSYETPYCSDKPLAMEASNLEVPSSGYGRREVPSSENGQMNCNLLDQLENNNKVEMLLDDEGSATCSSGIREGSLEGSASDHDSDGWEVGDTNMADIVLSPDYLAYKDLYCTDSELSFSSSCVKLKGVNANGSKESFNFEWGIIDVIGIESQWFARVETVLVKLQLRPDADLRGAAVSGTSGIVELKFAVYDPHWSESQKKIMSLDAKYIAIWTILINADANEEDPFNGRTQRKHYFPMFDEPFEDVIYPKGDPDAVSLSKRDIELLQPETFINDTIIDFYIKYLKNNIRPEERNRFHFFNSFFFRKLADLDKNPSSASEGRAAFLRVRKWTRKVNLFEKDYVFIPVNFNLHWSLIVICHPGEVANFKDEEVDRSHKVPCILHMDSIKGSHKGLKNLVQSYLWEEWKERQPEAPEDISPKFSNLRFVPLELPQQENSFDCGLFLLHYVERFLEEAPVSFNPFRLTRSSNFLHLAWFPPSQASLKRAFIQKLIYGLLKDNSQDTHPTAHDKECHGFPSMDNHIKKENGVEFFVEQHIGGNSCHDLISCPNDDQGIEMELLGNPGASQVVRNSGMVLELFGQGTTVGSISNGQCESFDPLIPFNKFNGVTMPDQVDRETGKLFTISSLGGIHGRSVDACSAGDVCTTSSLFQGFEICDKVAGSGVLAGEKGDGYTGYISCEAFSCGSQSSSELVVDENLPLSGSLCPNRQEEDKTDILVLPDEKLHLRTPKSSDSGCSEDLDTHIVEDSQEVDRVVDDDEKRNNLSYCQENDPKPDPCEVHLVENLNQLARVPESRHDIIPSEAVEPTAKRARLALPVD